MLIVDLEVVQLNSVANYRIRGQSFGKQKRVEKVNHRAGVNTIYELDEELLNSKEYVKLLYGG